MDEVSVIGAGLAGCEAAMKLADSGIRVNLYEMKPQRFSPAHTNAQLAELVCSNSLKSEKEHSAPYILKREMSRLGSLVLRSARKNRVAAGGALAVDRALFSDTITGLIEAHENIRLIRRELDSIPQGKVIIATGPLTSEALSQCIAELCGSQLYFYDAAAPIVSADSIDMEHAFFAGRYDQDADYINCVLNEQEYSEFHKEITGGETVKLHEFEKHFEACMPIETLAKRGYRTPLFGPMSPKGLLDRNGKRPYAVVQLRKEDEQGSMYNMVGFQTNLKFGEQKRIFSIIPALRNAEYLRYGAMHRNTYIQSPQLLDNQLRLKAEPRIRFAGQITGVEGYVESAASGIFAGLSAAMEFAGELPVFPATTAMGALIQYVSAYNGSDFQPMNVNFGIIEQMDTNIRNRTQRQKALSDRAEADFEKAASRYGIALQG